MKPKRLDDGDAQRDDARDDADDRGTRDDARDDAVRDARAAETADADGETERCEARRRR